MFFVIYNRERITNFVNLKRGDFKMEQQPSYVAEKSLMGECGGRLILCFLFCWLIVPLLIGIYLILKTKSYSLHFYPNQVVVKSGILNKTERQSAMFNVLAVRVEQSLAGTLFNYGDVYVDMVGRWDVNTEAIKDPKGLQNYLNALLAAQPPVQQFISQ